MARVGGRALILLSLIAACVGVEDATCSADGSGRCQGHQGASALQGKVHAQQTAEASEEAAETATKLLAGVRVNVRGVPKGHQESLPGRHTWVISLPDDCSDEDVRAFAEKMPQGASPVFEGLASDGLCFFAMEGTEAELAEELEGHPGAVLAEADLGFEAGALAARSDPRAAAGRQSALGSASLLEADARTSAGRKATAFAYANYSLAELDHSMLPPFEGMPFISPALLPQRVSMLESDKRTGGAYAAVRHVNVPTHNYDNLCGGPFMVNVYYPVQREQPNAPMPKMPLITYGHGLGCGGGNLDTFYTKSLQALVESGFVVVAPQNGPTNWCGINVDMLFSIHWLKGTQFASRIDFEKVAIYGYSMGAREALVLSSIDPIIKDFGIKAVVALMPYCVHGCPHPRVPVLYYTGTDDTICPAHGVQTAFEQTKGVPKVLMNTAGANHFESGPWGANRNLPQTIGMLRCHLHDDRTACDAVYATRCAAGATTDCTMLSESWPGVATPAGGSGNYKAVMGCPRKQGGPMTADLHRDTRIARRCCSNAGQCSSYPCANENTWDQADAHCRSQGLRLCTQQELEGNKCCNKGCSHDKRYVWSSTPTA